ncbi:hypothetical protein [Streptomyces sp. XD-27]|uniref:hypothetical protein n=1 Tax=Streptomyces sp. XD-27 TaxID=3062779 RepID=UPI0026F4799F|nr:hypothetical protein [Streptomyces sp. XD-27]WKX71677.1 hypothetical protein Q3Y56_18760 [Streptomyces sp. XD-27]
MAQAKKVVTYMLIVFALFTIIKSPKEAADLVQVGFEGISDAAESFGDFVTALFD